MIQVGEPLGDHSGVSADREKRVNSQSRASSPPHGEVPSASHYTDCCSGCIALQTASAVDLLVFQNS